MNRNRPRDVDTEQEHKGRCEQVEDNERLREIEQDTCFDEKEAEVNKARRTFLVVALWDQDRCTRCRDDAVPHGERE